jgi:hypothetical protein
MFYRNELKLWQREIISDKGDLIHPDEVSRLIIECIWQQLQTS